MASPNNMVRSLAKGAAKLLPQTTRKGLLSFLQSVVPPKSVANSFSQCGEDRILAFLFDSLKIKNPKYLDIGTCHPIKSNNTYLFYSRGATGVCVEPNPELAPLIREVRPRDTVVNAGVALAGGSDCTYYMFEEPSLNTFDAGQAKARTESGKFTIVKQISVPTVDINDLIGKHFPDGLDLLSLDAEGLDLPLLQALNLEKHRPFAICVETVGYSESLAKPKASDITTLLLSKGYGIYADTFVNTIYVDLEKTGVIAL